jgi:hypothetical protein
LADNYLQFSEVIPNLMAPEEEWLKRQLEGIAVVDGVEYPYELGDCQVAVGDGDKTVPVDAAEFAGSRAYRDMKDYDFDVHGDSIGFEYRFDNDSSPPDGHGRHMWIYADEGSEPALVAHLVQKFLRQFRPRDCWSLTYSASCSKARVGEFSGGAVFVTAARIKWQNSYQFVEQQRAAFLTR